LNLLAQLGVIKQQVCDELVDAYVSLRALLHAQVLQDKQGVINPQTQGEKIPQTVKNVEAYWEQFMVSCAP